MLFSILQAASAEVTTNLDIILRKLFELGVTAGKHLLVAALVFVVGRLIIGIINKLVAKLLSRRHIDASVQSFLRSLVKIMLTVLLIISVIGALGVNTTSFAALLASAGVAIGMALSGNLQNFAGGLVILLFKPYRVGDWIEVQGVQGKVQEIQIFHTLLLQADNKVVFIPNGSMSTAVVVNYTRTDTRRVEWTVGIDYGESVDKAKDVILNTIKADQRIQTDPEPAVLVSALADSSVNLTVRVWVKNDDYWPVFHDIYNQIYDQFNAAGISIPFPQQTVHIVKD
ncbi:MAG: mechanosensitive ion channel [Alloprevotella sp.]|nr:mechanosensitive ion channel [Prevotellamassilia sp.]MCI6144254.1 mechanosensitive ion channel [Bacteroidales bacterium]MDY2624257.1 mechanosensitive ion channel [Alloprevotella sp.]MDD7563209.1 mechanosensitive ion channel [Prevotellamassilia sp.]MDY2779130.1 mechanosensitive ion channel [Alloprevotella sp.]